MPERWKYMGTIFINPNIHFHHDSNERPSSYNSNILGGLMENSLENPNNQKALFAHSVTGGRSGAIGTNGPDIGKMGGNQVLYLRTDGDDNYWGQYAFGFGSVIAVRHRTSGSWSQWHYLNLTTDK